MKYIIVILAFSFSLPAVAADYDTIYKAKYSWGHEVNSVTLCNSKVTYWANFNWAGQEMLAFYKRHKKQPYQSLYITFRGHLLDEVVDGFAADYAGLMRISEVLDYSFEPIPSCQ